MGSLKHTLLSFVHDYFRIKLRRVDTQSREFVDKIGEKLKVSDLKDWYKISHRQIKEVGGQKILGQHNSSVSLMLSNVYPEYDWLPWQFDPSPVGIWENLNNHKKFVHWASSQLNLNDLDDWYKVSNQVQIPNSSTNIKTIRNLGGGKLLQSYYKNSLAALLSFVYPKHTWIPWKFVNIPNNTWNDLETQRKFFEHAANHFHIKSMDDWHKISTKVTIFMCFLLFYRIWPLLEDLH